MAKCPFAKQRILPESGTQKKIVPAIIIDHSQAGTGSLYNYWLTGTGLECHFWVSLDGTIEQYMDTEVQADANLEANRWIEGSTGYGAISIETENSRQATYNAYRGGQGAAAFYEDPWTPAQIASLKKLHKWLADTHPTIKRQKCNAPTIGGRGLGYHSMWGTGPTPWIPYKSRGKTCPCRYRIEQWHRELLPDFTKQVVTPAPEPDLPQENPDMALAFRFADGKVWLCTGTHREHLKDRKTLNERAIVGLISPVPKDDKNREDDWVRKANKDAERILSDLVVVS